MARRLSARELAGLPRPARRRADRHLAPETMNRYLEYRLRLVEAEIRGIVHDLERSPILPFLAALDNRPLPENLAASWANLNYLLQARENIRVALVRSSQAPQ